MATIKLTVLKAKALIDGKYKIQISICHKRKTCYIATNVIIEKLSQFKNGQIIKHSEASVLNAKLRNILNTYQDRLYEIKHVNIYDCKQLRDILIEEAPQEGIHTFQSYCKKFINQLEEEKRNSYAILHKANLNYFTEFTRGDMALSDITPTLIGNYDKYLRKYTNMNNTTIDMMLGRTRTVINFAKKEQLVKYDIDPFAFRKIRSSPVRDAAISLMDIKKIIDYKPKYKKYIVARDVFLLSFYLGGMNLVDMLEIDFKGKSNIEYIRTKSKRLSRGENKIIIPIATEAKEIINKWIGRNGKLDFGYKFSYHNFNSFIGRNIRGMAEELEINERVIMYSARKTFAQFASDLGIPDAVIDYCLGHSDKSRGVIRYYTKVRQKQAEIAINRVVDYINSPDKYKDLLDLRLDTMLMKA